MKNVFCLFDSRHPLPKNQGALFSDFDFNSFTAAKTENYNKAKDMLKNGETVNLYVTGLTPALTEFLSDVKNVNGQLILLYFDRTSNSYIEQNF